MRNRISSDVMNGQTRKAAIINENKKNLRLCSCLLNVIKCLAQSEISSCRLVECWPITSGAHLFGTLHLFVVETISHLTRSLTALHLITVGKRRLND